MSYVGGDGRYDVGDTVRLAGLATDPDGDTLSYRWVQNSGAAVAISNPTNWFTSFVIGAEHAGQRLSFYLQASDGEATTNSNSVNVQIQSSNSPPTSYGAAAWESGFDGSYTPGDYINLFASGVDPDGDSLTYQWIQTAGPSVSLGNAFSSSTSFSIGSQHAGQTLRFYARISDGQATVSTNTVQIDVEPPNTPPSFTFAFPYVADDGEANPGDQVYLYSYATDADGDSLSYTWHQSSGPSVSIFGANSANASFIVGSQHVGQSLGFYARVSDGQSTAYSSTFYVQPKLANVAPKFSYAFAASPSDGEHNPGDTVNLYSYATDANGDNLTYRWYQSGGPSVSFTNPYGRNLSFVLGSQHVGQTLSFYVQVYDGNKYGYSGTIQIQVVETNYAPVLLDHYVHNSTDGTSTPGSRRNSLDFRVGDIVRLQGVASDANGDDIDFIWTSSGPPVTLHDADTDSPWFQIGPEHANDWIDVSLQLSDGTTTVNYETVFGIEVINSAPTIESVYAEVQADDEFNIGDTVTLRANATDADGEKLTYSWFQTGGSPVTLLNETSDAPSFILGAEHADETLRFNVRVFDQETHTDSSTIFVNVDNSAPTITSVSAQAQPDDSFHVNDTVVLEVNATDFEGDDLTFSWEQVGGPAVILSDPTDQNPNFLIGPQHTGETLSFRVNVSDGTSTIPSNLIEIAVAAEYRRAIPYIPSSVSALPNSNFLSLAADYRETYNSRSSDENAYLEAQEKEVDLVQRSIGAVGFEFPSQISGTTTVAPSNEVYWRTGTYTNPSAYEFTTILAGELAEPDFNKLLPILVAQQETTPSALFADHDGDISGIRSFFGTDDTSFTITTPISFSLKDTQNYTVISLGVEKSVDVTTTANGNYEVQLAYTAEDDWSFLERLNVTFQTEVSTADEIGDRHDIYKTHFVSTLKYQKTDNASAFYLNRFVDETATFDKKSPSTDGADLKIKDETLTTLNSKSKFTETRFALFGGQLQGNSRSVDNYVNAKTVTMAEWKLDKSVDTDGNGSGHILNEGNAFESEESTDRFRSEYAATESGANAADGWTSGRANAIEWHSFEDNARQIAYDRRKRTTSINEGEYDEGAGSNYVKEARVLESTERIDNQFRSSVRIDQLNPDGEINGPFAPRTTGTLQPASEAVATRLDAQPGLYVDSREKITIVTTEDVTFDRKWDDRLEGEARDSENGWEQAESTNWGETGTYRKFEKEFEFGHEMITTRNKENTLHEEYGKGWLNDGVTDTFFKYHELTEAEKNYNEKGTVDQFGVTRHVWHRPGTVSTSSSSGGSPDYDRTLIIGEESDFNVNEISRQEETLSQQDLTSYIEDAGASLPNIWERVLGFDFEDAISDGIEDAQGSTYNESKVDNVEHWSKAERHWREDSDSEKDNYDELTLVFEDKEYHSESTEHKETINDNETTNEYWLHQESKREARTALGAEEHEIWNPPDVYSREDALSRQEGKLEFLIEAAGFIPVVGDFIDAANAVRLVSKGDFFGAAMSAVSVIPIVGDLLGKGAKAARGVTKLADKADDSLKFADDVLTCRKVGVECFAGDTPIVTGLPIEDSFQPIVTLATGEVEASKTTEQMLGATVVIAAIVGGMGMPPRDKARAKSCEQSPISKALARRRARHRLLDDTADNHTNEETFAGSPTSCDADGPPVHGYRRRTARIGIRSFQASIMLLCLFVASFGIQRVLYPTSISTKSQLAAGSTTHSILSEAKNEPIEATPISDIRIGDWVVSENPQLSDRQSRSIDFYSGLNLSEWRIVNLELVKPSGGTVYVDLLRPESWLIENNVEVDRFVALELPEMGADGQGRVVSVRGPPTMDSRPSERHQLVTGKFRHQSQNGWIVNVNGSDQPIRTTASHPFWSVGVQGFVAASNLQPGDFLRGHDGSILTVAATAPASEPVEVFNIEVAIDHVYFVGDDGILVHNRCTTGLFAHHHWPAAWGNNLPNKHRNLALLTYDRHRDLHKALDAHLVKNRLKKSDGNRTIQLSTRGGTNRGKDNFIDARFNSEEMFDALNEFYSDYDSGRYYQSFVEELQVLIDEEYFDAKSFGALDFIDIVVE